MKLNTDIITQQNLSESNNWHIWHACLRGLHAHNHINNSKSITGRQPQQNILPLHCIHSFCHVFIKGGSRREEWGAGRSGRAVGGLSWHTRCLQQLASKDAELECVRVAMAQWGKQMQTSHTDTQMERAEQKRTHGSGRILKPGPCSIKASLGPSSLEAPPSLLCCRLLRPVDVLLPPPPSLSLVVCWAASSLSCLLLYHSAAPPCLPHSAILRPPFISSCIRNGSHVHHSKGREAWVSPCVCLRLLIFSIHSYLSLSLSHHVILSQHLIGQAAREGVTSH